MSGLGFRMELGPEQPHRSSSWRTIRRSTVDGQNPACPYIPKLWNLWHYTILSWVMQVVSFCISFMSQLYCGSNQITREKAAEAG